MEDTRFETGTSDEKSRKDKTTKLYRCMIVFWVLTIMGLAVVYANTAQVGNTKNCAREEAQHEPMALRLVVKYA